MRILDNTQKVVTSGNVQQIIVPPDHMLMQVLATAEQGDAVLSIGSLTFDGAASSYQPMVQNRVLPAGRSARIRFPPLRGRSTTGGGAIVASSDRPVTWTVQTQSFSALQVTALTRYAANPYTMATGYGPSAAQGRVRIAGVVIHATGGAGGRVELFHRTGATPVYRPLCQPTWIDGWGTAKLAPGPVLEYATADAIMIRGDCRTMTTFYGAIIP